MIYFEKQNDSKLLSEINKILFYNNIPLSLNKSIMDLARPYRKSKFNKGEIVYKKSNLYVALHIYEEPYWNEQYKSWRYNYDYGLTCKDGSAFESDLVKKKKITNVQ